MKASLLEAFNRYLLAQAALPEEAREPKPLAITILREVGAGRRTIAQLEHHHAFAERERARLVG